MLKIKQNKKKKKETNKQTASVLIKYLRWKHG